MTLAVKKALNPNASNHQSAITGLRIAIGRKLLLLQTGPGNLEQDFDLEWLVKKTLLSIPKLPAFFSPLQFCDLTLSQTSRGFYVSAEQVL